MHNPQTLAGRIKENRRHHNGAIAGLPSLDAPLMSRADALPRHRLFTALIGHLGPGGFMRGTDTLASLSHSHKNKQEVI